MKKTLKFLSVILAVVFCGLIFASCKSQSPLKRVSKNLSFYKIDATLNDDMVVEAKMEVDVKNSTETILNELCFNLYPRAFREDAKIKPYTSFNEGKCFPAGKSYGDIEICDVKVEGEKTAFNFVGEDENALKVPLFSELMPKEFVKVNIDFVLTLPECTHRFGYFNSSVNLGNWYPVLAIYESGEFNIAPYYSTGDPFFSDIANYEVSFSYPESYHLSSTGVEKSNLLHDGLKTSKLSAQATRDFAINLTAEENTLTKEVDGIKVKYVGYSEDENIASNMDVSLKAVKLFNKIFGKYPYEKLDVVKAPFVHGGMEYPAMVIISDSIDDDEDIARVIVHEIAHQWWYAVVGNNEIDEAWLDESLAEYSSLLFFEEYPEYKKQYEELVGEAFAGYVIYADIVSTLDGKVNTSMLLPVNEYNSEYEYSYMIYIRGVLMFDGIRQIVGKQNMLDGFKKYYSTYKFKIATTDDFIATFNKASKKDVSGLFDSWLSGSALVGVI